MAGNAFTPGVRRPARVAALVLKRDRARVAARGRACQDLLFGGDEAPKVTTEIIRHQYLDILRRCSFHIKIRNTNRAMRILRAKRYSFAPAMSKPERKSPSIPTVEMISPLYSYAVHDEIIFDHLA